MKWTEDEILVGEELGHFPKELLRQLLRLLSNMATCGICDANFVGHCVELCEKVVAVGKCNRKIQVRTHVLD